MSKGQVREINDKYIVADLLQAKYIEPIEKTKSKKSS